MNKTGKSVKTAYWCVKSVTYANGDKDISLSMRKREQRPNDTRISKTDREISNAWFVTKHEAEAHYNEIKPKLPQARAEKAQPQFQMLTAEEAAKMLAVSLGQIYNLAKNGDIPACKLRGSVRFALSDVEDYIFFSKYSHPELNLRPSDKEALFDLIKERCEEEKAYLERFFERVQKRWEKEAV